jgi:exopolysaccharide biosynthesis polyprenyl glycosylphosphotransferase
MGVVPVSIVDDWRYASHDGPELLGLPATEESLTDPVRIPTLRWRQRYASVLLISDLGVLGVAMAAAQLSRFGTDETFVRTTEGALPYSVLGVVVALAWWVSLQFHRTRSHRVVGHGVEEYRRVVVATFRVFAVLAMLSLMFKVDASRGYLAIAAPVGLIGLLAGRKAARVALHRRRALGYSVANVMIIGGPRGAAQINDWFASRPSVGYRVSGVWVPDVVTAGEMILDGEGTSIPVLTASASLGEALRATQAEAVLVTDTDHLGATGLRELTWQLDGTGIELMISPNVLDVVGSRLHLHDLSGMPMLHLDEPQYAGAGRYTKSLLDRVGAFALIVLFSPVLLVTAIAVKATSSGPVFYRQVRVGLGGRTFKVTKFRSMVADADRRLEGLRGLNEADAVLFKMRNDPRVTSVGRWIRRFSIDELPQLFDVLAGHMSLVGPRPPLPTEVAQYPRGLHRRMFVRPGMTGLWQVSGRSDLSFDEASRLDLTYVENWSITGDLMIMVRTLRAVLRSEGAY